MTMHVRNGGAWKQVSQPAVRVGGAWKNVVSGWVRVSGVWKKFYDAIAVALSNQTVDAFATSPATATAAYRLSNDGSAYKGVNGSFTAIAGEWLLSGAASDYECMVTVNSGSLSSGATGAWLSLVGTHTWSVVRSTNGISTCNITVQIRPNSGSVVASCTVDLTAEREV